MNDNLFIGGLVSYVDYKVVDLDLENALNPYAYKRRSFEHEREARIVRLGGEESVGHKVMKYGLDLKRMVQAAYIAPESPSWYQELIEGIVRTYRYDFSVIQSDIETDPIF